MSGLSGYVYFQLTKIMKLGIFFVKFKFPVTFLSEFSGFSMFSTSNSVF